MIYIHWGYCRCEDCGKTFYTPLDGNGAAAFPHSGCKEAKPITYEKPTAPNESDHPQNVLLDIAALRVEKLEEIEEATAA